MNPRIKSGGRRKGTQMNTDASVLNPLSKRVIGCALTVSNALGSGFLEKVYENALAHELRKAALAVEQQRGASPFPMTGSRSVNISPICWWKTRFWSN
jgi:hypothetical protein